MSNGPPPDLIAVLLVTASASGANLVFRWPPNPRLPVRFARPKPLSSGPPNGLVPGQVLIDAAYGASHALSNDDAEAIVRDLKEDPAKASLNIYADHHYLWHRSALPSSTSGHGGTGPSSSSTTKKGPQASHISAAETSDSTGPSKVPFDQGASISGSDSATMTSRADVNPASNIKAKKSADGLKNKPRGPSSQKKYDELIGYEASFLAELLSPVPSMCHQKFELVVDELAFIGHPVHAKVDGSWDFAELSGAAQTTPSADAGPAGGGHPTTPLSPVDERGRVHDRPHALAPRAFSQQPRQMFQAGGVGTDDDNELDDGAEEGDIEEMAVSRSRSRSHRPSLGHSKSTSRSVSLKGMGQLGQSLSMAPATAGPGARRLLSGRHPPTQLKSFHLVLVIDRPDPSSLASTNLDRYIDAYYTQFAFKLTAAMLYEQGRTNFIAQEAQYLLGVREKYLSSKSSPPQSDREFEKFFDRALHESTLASAMRTAYEAVVSSSICQVLINTVPVNIQLPPRHLDLLKAGTESSGHSIVADQTWGSLEQDDELGGVNDDGTGEERLEDELRFGWRVPPLRPWKTVVLLDHAIRPSDIVVAGRRLTSGNPMMNPAEILPRFMAAASPTMTLFGIAQVMKVDLETELYSLVRLLVYNRKAKVLDVVRMVNVYTLPSILPRPLFELSEQFSMEFPTLSPLPVLLSALTISHRTFASIVGTPTASNNASSSALDAYASSPQRSDFFRVLIWMLTHELLVMLHVRVRIYITTEIKAAALRTQRAEKAQRVARKAKRLAREAASLNRANAAAAEASLNGSHPPSVPKTNSSASIRSSASRLTSASRSRSRDLHLSPITGTGRHLSHSRSPSASAGGGVSGGSEEAAPRSRHKHAVSFDRVVSVDISPLTSGLSTSRAPSSEATLNDEEVGSQDAGSKDAEDDEDDEEEEEDEDLNDESVSGDEQPLLSGRRGSKLSSELETSELEEDEDGDLTPSFLVDPERATRAQRRWLDEICRGHEMYLVKGFRRITPYLDGKMTTDEIMYRSGISRGQLREILRHFDTYLMLFLHP